jgi:hypothetical protein
MNFESLIGKTFAEQEFYELLLFDIEENFDQYQSKFMNVYFESQPEQMIKIIEVKYFNDSHEMNQIERKNIEKRSWFHIGENDDHFNLVLIRLDRTGKLSSIWKEHTRTEDWCFGWADEDSHTSPMTPEEIRLGVLELCGFFEVQQDLQKSKSKIAI